MAVLNADIARIFEEIADLLEIRDENPFRVRAYRNAARLVNDLAWEISAHIAAGRALPKMAGIGADLTGKITEIATTGHCALLDQLRGKTAPALAELLRLPGLGPKRVRALHEALGIDTTAALRQALESGRVRELRGFGVKTEQRILEALQRRADSSRRFLWATAHRYAEALVQHLRGVAGVTRVTVAGSFRRMKETVGDLDILVTARDAADVTQAFCNYGEAQAVLARGSTRSSIALRAGLQVDLRVVPEESYGAALHYFTGSKAHNIAVRRLAQARGLKINEYGVFKGTQRVAGETEASVFRSVGLPFIEPELREDTGEIDAASANRLPSLIALGDLRGDLHCHSSASDGRNSIREMARAAQKQGLAYLAITDHSQRLAMAHGLNALRLEQQIADIERINRELHGVTVLSGIEVDILEDGTLDLPDAILSRLDVVVAAVHSRFELPLAKQTQRVLAAMDNPYVRILAHPSGRLIGEREPCELDWERIMTKALERDIALELNAQPQRLDLTEDKCRMAKDRGVLLAINADAHSAAEFGNLRFGVGQARRGWLEPRNVLNTWPLDVLERWLRREQRSTKTKLAA